MSARLDPERAAMLIAALTPGSEVVYWRSDGSLAADRRDDPEIDAVARLFLDAAETGAGDLFQRRRPVAGGRGRPTRAPATDGWPDWLDGFATTAPRVTTDYCFRRRP